MRQAQVASRSGSARTETAKRPLGKVSAIERGDEIDDRERDREEGLERRIGSVYARTASPSLSPKTGTPAHSGDAIAVGSAISLSVDRGSLRRAILMNEILGPPLALRDPHSHDNNWDAA